MKTIKRIIISLLIFLGISISANAKRVAVFYNSTFIDVSPSIASEGSNVVATLQAFGHNVTTFTGFSATAINAALAGKDVLVIPEQERANLNNSMNASSRTAIRNFVQGGGVLIVMANGSNYEIALLNATFGWSLARQNRSVLSFPINASQAVGTNFAALPRVAFLPVNNGTYPWSVSFLPAGAKNIYSSGNNCAVAEISSGSGKVIFLAYDWFDARPRGRQDGGWLNIMNRAVNSAVSDNQAPTVRTRDVSLSLNASGQAILNPLQVNDGSTDNVGITNFSVSPNTFDCSDIGANTVILTATDAASNSASAPAIVTVLDNTSPAVNTKPITLQLDASGNASITTADLNNGSSDNCKITTLSLSKTAFNCSDLGSNTVSLTATDASSNSSVANNIVTVLDKLAPIVSTKSITVQLNASGTASITAADVNDGSSDNCGITSLSLDKTTFDCSDLGSNTITLTATDGSSNSASASATVTVVDNVAPLVSTKAITVQLNASGTASITTADVNDGSSDNCGITSLSLDKLTFDCSDLGSNTVNLTATDGSSNSASASATVTVVDNLSPLVAAKAVTVQLNASGTVSITAADVNDGSADNCGITALSLDKTTFDCSDLGSNTITLTAIDGSLNSASASATVIVEDNVAPIVATKNITVQLNSSGTASITTADVNDGSSDNCGITALSLDKTTFDCNDLGSNTVNLTAIDGSSNSASAPVTVTVVDNISPSAAAKSITVQLDASGGASITAADVNDGSSDNCGITSLSLDKTSFDCSDLGSNTVTLTAIDASLNSSSATVTVMVVDNIAPTVRTRNLTVQLNSSATASITTADVDNESTDNCSIASMSLDRTTFGCVDVGVQTVVLTVIDNSGNSSSAPAFITVLSPPEMSISPILENGGDVYSNFDGSFTATFGYKNNNACPVNTPVGPDNAFTPSPVNRGQVVNFLTGRQQNAFITKFYSGNLVWTLKSPDGSVRTATATAPSGRVRPILENVVDNGNGTFTAHFGYLNENSIVIRIPVGPNNNFSPGNAGNNQPIEFNPGRHYDVFTVNLADCQSMEVWTLQSPNSAGGTATASPNDQTPPAVVTQNITLQLNSNGNAVLDPTDVDGGSSDFCGIASYTITSGPTSYNCADVGGIYQVELTVTDINGLSASGFANVSVSDSNLPDNDNDNISDVCDPDDDNDGIPDNIDKYPFDATNNGRGVILTYVWDDLNGDGLQDAGEPPVQGVPINLYSNSNKLIAETSTEAEGLAAFFDLKEGQKVKMEFLKQSGQVFTHSNVGGNNAIDSDVNSKNGRTSLIKIKASQILTDVDAGIWSEGSIVAYVWEDQNGNGLQDLNEPPIPGVRVRYMTTRNQIYSQKYTDANGMVRFDGVPANENRRLQFVAPPNYSYTLKDEGSDDNIDSDANQGDGRTAPFKTTQGAQVITHVDAGLIAPSFIRLAAGEDQYNHSELALKLFPNPVHTDFTLKVNSPIEEDAVIVIFDLMGKRIMEEEVFLRQGENSFNMDFTAVSIASGQYILSLYPASQPMKSLKLIKD